MGVSSAGGEDLEAAGEDATIDPKTQHAPAAGEPTNEATSKSPESRPACEAGKVGDRTHDRAQGAEKVGERLGEVLQELAQVRETVVFHVCAWPGLRPSLTLASGPAGPDPQTQEKLVF